MAEQSLSAVDPACLHYDQFHAYDIIIAHLNATLAGQCLPPLRMLIHGESGTGKSKAIQTATEHFVHRGARFMLQKAAYTGIAASLINGKTTHNSNDFTMERWSFKCGMQGEATNTLETHPISRHRRSVHDKQNVPGQIISKHQHRQDGRRYTITTLLRRHLCHSVWRLLSVPTCRLHAI